MLPTSATLHLFAGKIASGKSTLATEVSKATNGVLIREDEWLDKLFSAEMKTVSDYALYSARLRKALDSHVVRLLQSGITIVLDFPANTIELRQWMLSLAQRANCPHEVHYLDVPDEICKSRLQSRNASGDHEFSVTEEQYELVKSHFVAPAKEEGLNIVVHMG